MAIPMTIPGWEAYLPPSPQIMVVVFVLIFLDLLLTLDVTRFSLAGLVHRQFVSSLWECSWQRDKVT